ncbi:MAG: hypothetical protein JSW20_03685 [Nitrospiraceae bacterium]|nr:MAG: hypothetical protein JSW20_03685 [Nitrospiraceae bacterium]
MKSLMLTIIVLLIIVSPVSADEKYGVYIKVVEKVQGSFDEVSSVVEEGLKKSGWKILGSHDTGVPEKCGFRSRAIYFSSEEYAVSILKNGVNAVFALPLRAGIYEDEKGINITIVNPPSIKRTIIDETGMDEYSLAIAKAIVETIAGSVNGDVVNEQAGQIRKRGKIGGMGGGDFLNKIDEIRSFPNSSESTLRQIAEKVKGAILRNDMEWKLMYSYDLTDRGAVIYGVTKTGTEGKAFSIAGEKRVSDSNNCPGIDHVAAFPIEVVVYKEGERVRVVLMDEMYRMKLYFEDAGMWAFMKNMKMPGRIEKEIIDVVSSGLDKQDQSI